MRLTQICVRFPKEMTEEVSRLAKANGLTPSEMVRELVRDGIVVRAEALTNSQFAYVEKRLRRMEDRFAGWMIKLSKAISMVWFFVEELALYEVDEKDQIALKQAAQSFARQFLQQKTSSHLKDDQEHLDQE